MKNRNDAVKRAKKRIASSVICALYLFTAGLGMTGCMPDDQVSEPPLGVGTSCADVTTDSKPQQAGVTSRKHTVTTKPQTAYTTEPVIEWTEPWFEDLPEYVIEDGIVWYGGGYTMGDSTYWEGKNIVDPFWWAIKDTESNEEELKYAVFVTLYADDQYEYNGKTLAEYKEDEFHESVQPMVLEELLKVGDQLKYGELLYTTGTPDGERWAKELYDQTVEYFGEELLSKYIVDGEFLFQKVMADMKEPMPTVAKEALREARIAYLDEKLQFMQEYLTGLGVENAIFTKEESDFVPKYMIFFITKEQFAGLSCADLGIEDGHRLFFSLVAKEEYESALAENSD